MPLPDSQLRTRYRPTSPSTGLLAVAYIFRGILPARYANRPALTASFIASAIATGSCAAAIAVFIPNGFADGYPGKLYTRGEAEQAIADATIVNEFCRSHLPR